LVDVKFSAGVFVAAGGRVTAEVGFVNFVATSPDGIIWHGIDLTN
jgi:hypothetical protein